MMVAVRITENDTLSAAIVVDGYPEAGTTIEVQTWGNVDQWLEVEGHVRSSAWTRTSPVDYEAPLQRLVTG